MEFLSCAKAPIHRQHMAFLHGLNIRSVHLGVIGISPMDGDATMEAEQKRCLVLPGIEVQLHLWWSTLRLRSCHSMPFHAIPCDSMTKLSFGCHWYLVKWLKKNCLTHVSRPYLQLSVAKWKAFLNAVLCCVCVRWLVDLLATNTVHRSTKCRHAALTNLNHAFLQLCDLLIYPVVIYLQEHEGTAQLIQGNEKVMPKSCLRFFPHGTAIITFPHGTYSIDVLSKCSYGQPLGFVSC